MNDSCGKRIKELRQSINLTQKELADKLNITEAAISMYERNKRIPDNYILFAMSDLFKVTVDYLLCRADEKSHVLLDKESVPANLKPYIDALQIDTEGILTPKDVEEMIKAAIKIKKNLKN